MPEFSALNKCCNRTKVICSRNTGMGRGLGRVEGDLGAGQAIFRPFWAG